MFSHACPVLQGPGAVRNTGLIAEIYPSLSVHILHNMFTEAHHIQALGKLLFWRLMDRKIPTS